MMGSVIVLVAMVLIVSMLEFRVQEEECSLVETKYVRRFVDKNR